MSVTIFAGPGSSNAQGTGESKDITKPETIEIDRAKILVEPDVFAEIAAFKLKDGWEKIKPSEREAAAREVLKVIDRFKNKVVVDSYLTRGLKASSDFFLRLHAYDLSDIQDFLIDFRSTRLGNASDEVTSLLGVSKPLNYITKDKAPELSESLKSASFSDPAPRYAIVIPTKKNAKWWNLASDEQLKEIETHTQVSLPYLNSVKRKLYHSTGLDDADFITYFETSNLTAFNNLMIALVSIPENRYNVRLGNPTLLGTIQSPEAMLKTLSK